MAGSSPKSTNQTHSSGLSGERFQLSVPSTTVGSDAFQSSRSTRNGMMYRISGGRNQPKIANSGLHVVARPNARTLLAMRNIHTMVSTPVARVATLTSSCIELSGTSAVLELALVETACQEVGRVGGDSRREERCDQRADAQRSTSTRRSGSRDRRSVGWERPAWDAPRTPRSREVVSIHSAVAVEEGTRAGAEWVVSRWDRCSAGEGHRSPMPR